MTLLSVYGMDMYTTKTDFFAEPDWTAITDTNVSIQTNQGRFGTGALRLIGAGGLGDVIQLAIGSAPTTLFFGGSIKIANYNHDSDILRFLEGINEHMKLRLSNINNNVEFHVNGVLQANFDMTVGFWHRLEVKIVVSDTIGSIDILIDRSFGTDFSTATQVSSVFIGDTQSGASSFTDIIEFLSVPAASLETEVLWDDITLNDDAGTRNNTWMGDIKIQTLRPNADTAQKDMTPSTGSTNFNLVDEAPGPDISDFVTPESILDKDLYAATDLSGTVTIVNAVQLKVYAQVGDIGNPTIRLLVKSGATEGASTSQALAAAQFHSNIFEIDPNTSGDWNVNTVNTVEIGVERDS